MGPDTPRRLSTPLLTPFDSAPTFARMDNYHRPEGREVAGVSREGDRAPLAGRGRVLRRVAVDAEGGRGGRGRRRGRERGVTTPSERRPRLSRSDGYKRFSLGRD
eukprot:1996-Pelagococcus_subviridis.AAC.7